jgi:hypothetical protein
VHRSLAAALLAACWACGSGPRDPASCPTIDGTFKATSTLADSSGNCQRAKSTSVDSFTFAKGSYKFPVDGVASCKTEELQCDIKVQCTSPALPTARFTFVGTLSLDGTHLTGTATFTGSYQGCGKVVYSVDATTAP